MLPKNNPLAKSRANLKFDEDLKAFLFAFGGDLPAQKDTVELLNDICVDFIAKTTAEAAAASVARNKQVDVNALLHTQRHNAQRQERILELAQSYDNIKRLKFVFKDVVTLAKKMPANVDSSHAMGGGGAAVQGEKDKQKRTKASANPGAATGQAASKKKRVKEDHGNAGNAPVSNGVSIVTASAASRANAMSAAHAAQAGAASATPISVVSALPVVSATTTAAPTAPPSNAEPSQTEFLL